MRRGNLFWATLLIAAGVLLLLNNLGILRVNVWGIIWPLALIALGVSALWRVFSRRDVETEHAVIPLDGARRARVKIKHGAGKLEIFADAGGINLAEGDFGGGLELDTHHVGDGLEVEMRMPDMVVAPWNMPWGGSLTWSVGMNPEIPLMLDLETGAGEAELNLTDLQVTDLRLRTGASSTRVQLPAQAGQTRVDLASGASSIVLYVPQGVAARIRAKGGLSAVSIDESRFPRFGDIYQSPDFDTAANRVEVSAETGVGAIEVR